MPLTQKELNRAVCDSPECTGESHQHGDLYLHSTCHIADPLWAQYNKETGILQITCSVCKKVVTNLEIAK